MSLKPVQLHPPHTTKHHEAQQLTASTREGGQLSSSQKLNQGDFLWVGVLWANDDATKEKSGYTSVGLDSEMDSSDREMLFQAQP